MPELALATSCHNTEFIQRKTAFPSSPIYQQCFKKSSKWKGMLCTFNASIWMCCILKTCYTTTKALYFYCKSPASGFHKAVSVYHTWLSNNNVVQQTPPYPEDITQEIGAGQASIHRSLPTLPFLSISLSLSSSSITYTLHYSLDYLGRSNMVCYPCHCCLKLSLSSVLLLSLLSLHLMLTHKS